MIKSIKNWRVRVKKTNNYGRENSSYHWYSTVGMTEDIAKTNVEAYLKDRAESSYTEEVVHIEDAGECSFIAEGCKYLEWCP